MNLANANAPKTSDPLVSANTKPSQDDLNGTETDDSAVSTGSFHESIKKAYDESKNASETESVDSSEVDQSGSDLPVAAEATETAAKDDRPKLPAGLYLSDQASSNDKQLKSGNTQTLPATAKIEKDSLSVNEPVTSSALDVEQKAEADGKLAGIPSQLRQLLASEKDGDAKNTKPGLTRSAGGSSETLSKSSDTVPVQSSETLTSKTESAVLASDKIATAVNTSGQQPSLANTQSSTLLQAVSAQSDSAGDASPLAATTTAVANPNPSNTNLQPTLPQAGITEAFGRPAWAQGMARQVLMMVNQNISSAEIRLNPAHLGPIEMLIDMKDEQVSVSMSSRHAIVREAMEQALPKLRDMLAQDGFSLAGTDISQHSFAEQREQHPHSRSKNFATNISAQPISSEISQRIIRQSALPSSMVDYYI